jgi:ATP-dependent RNA helicase RhlE
LLNEPQLIEVAIRNTAAETVTQGVYRCPQDAKRALLARIVKSRQLRQVLCFVRTKHGASRLARQLEKDGLETSAIHGDKTQAARIDALDAFKEGKLEVLVATDVAARGLDVDDLPLVVNYELPHVPEDYIHRIGRTGRAGATGEAVSFVSPEEDKYLVEIEKMLKKKIAVLDLDGFDPIAAAARTPLRERSERPRRGAARDTGETATHEKATRPPAPRENSEATVRASAHRAAPQARSEREIERELAYARNPDQPLPVRPAGGDHGAHHPRHAAKRQPIPALLMKRPSREPENA